MDSPKPSTVEPLSVFERKNSKNISQIAGFIIILFLNITLIGGDISISMTKHIINWRNELMTSSFLTFVDCTILLPIIFQVRRLSMWEDKIILQTIFWQKKLSWDQITGLNHPKNFTVSVLTTKSGFFLLSWKDLPDLPIFFAKVKEKLGESFIG